MAYSYLDKAWADGFWKKVKNYADSKSAKTYMQATGSGNTSAPSGTVTQVTLVSTGAISSGSGLSIESGGIQVTEEGTYLISASVYMSNPSAATARGVYIRVGSAFSTAAEVHSDLYTDTSGITQAGAIALAPKYLSLSAGDIVFLAGRIVGAAGTINGSNNSTFLSVTKC